MEKVGWVSTGVMGKRMCRHIIDAGYDVCIYNRTPSKAKSLLEAGGQWCESAAEVAKKRLSKL